VVEFVLGFGGKDFFAALRNDKGRLGAEIIKKVSALLSLLLTMPMDYLFSSSSTYFVILLLAF